ncbi:MAG: VOC family protein [Azospirillaceae bacterium]
MSFAPKNFTVWAEIPVTDLDRAMTFYATVFDIDLTETTDGPNPMAMFPSAEDGAGGHLYPGKPAARGDGPTVHFAVPDSLEAALGRVTEAGGTVLSDPISIPAGRFAYCQDPDGNSIGLFSA